MTIVYNLPPYDNFAHVGELVALDNGRFAVGRADGGFLSLDRTGKFRSRGEAAIGAWETATRNGNALLYEAESARNVAFILEVPE